MKERGFAGILLVLLVVAVLAAGVIGFCVFRVRAESSEVSGMGSLRAIITAETSYREARWKDDAGEPLGYSFTLSDLGCSLGSRTSRTAACLIDDVLARATSPKTAKSDYYFVYTRTNHGKGFTVNANPAIQGKGGYFYTDQSGVIRFNRQRVANLNDPPLQ